MAEIRRVCVFCGSRPGDQPQYLHAATALGEILARRGLELVYGGAHRGLMGAVADSVLAHGGRVTGVIPAVLVNMEVAHRGLTSLHIVETMHERKMLMADLSDAFIALPGGYGTLDELFETATWAQLGIHNKPFGLLNVGNYFDHLLAFVDHMVREGFIDAALRASLLTAATPASLLAAFDRGAPAPITPIVHHLVRAEQR